MVAQRQEGFVIMNIWASRFHRPYEDEMARWWSAVRTIARHPDTAGLWIMRLRNGSTIYDISGNGRHLSAINNPAFTDTPAGLGYATLNGTNQYFSRNYDPSDNSTIYTWGAFIRIDTLSVLHEQPAAAGCANFGRVLVAVGNQVNYFPADGFLDFMEFGGPTGSTLTAGQWGLVTASIDATADNERQRLTADNHFTQINYADYPQFNFEMDPCSLDPAQPMTLGRDTQVFSTYGDGDIGLAFQVNAWIPTADLFHVNNELKSLFA